MGFQCPPCQDRGGDHVVAREKRLGLIQHFGDSLGTNTVQQSLEASILQQPERGAHDTTRLIEMHVRPRVRR